MQIANANEKELLELLEQETEQDSKKEQKRTEGKSRKKKKAKDKKAQRQNLLEFSVPVDGTADVTVATSGPGTKQQQQQQQQQEEEVAAPQAKHEKRTLAKQIPMPGRPDSKAPQALVGGQEGIVPATEATDARVQPIRPSRAEHDKSQAELATMTAALLKSQTEHVAVKEKLWEMEGELEDQRSNVAALVKARNQTADDLRAEVEWRTRLVRLATLATFACIAGKQCLLAMATCSHCVFVWLASGTVARDSEGRFEVKNS